jgi:class 3 adenylate cyclase/tetratricopeptide (TPR) repeat protein/TolB-like protein
MRKLAAIMFTDIVGYSAIMSKDESLALVVLERNREIRKAALEEHNGEFIKEIGDGTLCIFQSSWDAVNCAVTIQRAMALETSFRLRIGIHIGDIVAADNDVFGDGVNIASRIESICEPGGICFTQRVYEDIQNKIDYKVTFTGEKNLKNIGQTVLVYSIPAAELQKGSTLPFETPFNTFSGPSSGVQRKSLIRKKSRAIIIIAGILVIILAGLFTLRPLVLEALVSNDPVPIAVISFENLTGDSKYDYLQKAIPNLLITNLEQSNLFHVITWERMQDLLAQMGKNDIKTIDPALGFEICRMEGCNIIVIGSYIKAGDTFVTDVKVLDVNTKQLLKSVSARGTGEASILQSQIDYLSKEISGSAGIPYQRIETAGYHVSDVTTSSMAAYDYFLKGRDALDKMYYNDAREYFEEAVRLDSTFAVAWLYLSNAYGSLQNIQMRNRAIEKAYAYSSRATEKEQITIKANYARIIENDPGEELRLLNELAAKSPRDKRAFYTLGVWYCNSGMPDNAITELNKAIDLDPNYSEPLNQVAYQYMKKGMYAEALSYFRRYVSLNPKEANPHDSMGDLLWQMGKFDEAIAEYSLALDIKPDFHVSAGKIGYIYAMKEDYPKAEHWMNRAITAAPSPGTKAVWHWANAWMCNWCGNLERANNSLLMSYNLAVSQDDHYTLAGINWLKAFMERDLGRYDSALARYDKAFHIFLKNTTDLKSDSAAYFMFNATVKLAEGRFEQTNWCLDNVKRLIPQIRSTSVEMMRYWYECTNIELLNAKKDYNAAVEQGKTIKLPALPEYEYPQVLIYNIPFSRDFLARAYAGLDREEEAIREYERLITIDPASNDRRLINPRYHYHLAKLYEETGQSDKALSQYRKFLELWKNADPVFPEPAEAKKRLEALTSQ